MKYAAWKVVGDDRIFFMLDSGVGGSSANIRYKAIFFREGVYLSETDDFHSGEYFRFYADDNCVALRNEYALEQGIKLYGDCE